MRLWSSIASVALATALAAISSCASTATPTVTSLAPLVPAGQLPATTRAPSTTLAPSSNPDSPLIAALPTDSGTDSCGYADQLAGGEITFVVGERLYGASVDGRLIRCLTALRPEQRGPVRWAPLGNRVLLNAATLIDGFGPRATGFEATNTRVQWEFPAGDGLIGPTTSNRTLVRRSAGDTRERTEVTFLASTLAAVSHPGGRVLLGAGQSADGTNGIFAAGAAGGQAQPLVTIADPTLVVVEIAADAGGELLYFVSDNGSQFRVHELTFSNPASNPAVEGPAVEGPSVQELSSEQAPISQLTTGPTARSLAWKVGLCNSVTETRVRDDRTSASLTVGAGTPLEGLALSPVGWLDAARLVVVARPSGCDGPADVWIWNLFDGSATLLVKNVDFPAVRIAADTAPPLVLSPTAQPVPL